MTVARDAHVAGDDAFDLAIATDDEIRGRKSGIDFHAQRFSFARQPAADIAEAGDVISMIAHQRRHQEIWNAQTSRWTQIV